MKVYAVHKENVGWLMLEGPFEYPIWTSEPEHCVRLPGWKASQLASWLDARMIACR